MTDISKVFIAQNGFGFNDSDGNVLTGLFSETTNPASGAGAPAPIGSLLLRTNGTLYIKSSAPNTGWMPMVRSDDLRLNPNNVLIVSQVPGPGQFSSIAAAVASAVVGPTSPKIVRVLPGVYFEPQIIMKQFVSVVGDTDLGVLVTPLNPNVDLFVIQNPGCELQNILILGVTGATAVKVTKSEIVSFLTNLFIVNCKEHIAIESTSAVTQVFATHIQHIPGSTTEHIVRVQSFSGQPAMFNQSNAIQSEQGAAVPLLQSSYFVTGPGALLNLNVSFATSDAGTSDFLVIENGGIARSASSFSIEGFDRGIVVNNVGAAPQIDLSFVTMINNVTSDLVLNHPGVTGFFNGSISKDKVTIAGDPEVSIFYSNNGEKGIVAVGPLYLGSLQNNITDVTDLIQQASPTGLLSGGILSIVSGLTINVTGGYGYVVDSVSLKEKRISWLTQNTIVADNAQNYVYVDNSGAITYSPSLPDLTQTILLGRARTNVGSIVFISPISYAANAIATYLDQFLRQAIGPIFGTGCVVTPDVTPLRFNVTAGTYYYSTKTINPSALIPATFFAYYHVSGVFVTVPGNTTVDNTQYDNGTDLTPLTAGYFTKHLLYNAGDGPGQISALVWGQAEYATQLEAEAASLPIPPSFFADITVPIATIIVQEGNPDIVLIQDVRPRLGFTAPSVSGSIRHGDLLGLPAPADDHCFSEDTELLTKDGWKKYTEIQNDDLAATFNIETEKIEFQQINGRYVYDNFDEMIHFTSRSVDLLVTAQHKIVAKLHSKQKQWNLIPAEELLNWKQVLMPRCGDEERFISGREGFYALLGWIVSEGSFCNTKTEGYGIKIFQDSRKQNQIRNLLENLNIPFTSSIRNNKGKTFVDPLYGEYQYNEDLHIFYIKSNYARENIRPYLNGKKLSTLGLQSISASEFDAFLNTACEGDGTKYSATKWAYYSKDKELIDQIQSLAVRFGYSTNSWLRESNEKSCWYISITRHKQTKISDYKKVPYKGNVWCVSVPNKTVVVRRNGKVIIAGNTQYLLVTGVRPMSGALNMGTNNITSVGTVNGVTVELHGSRHNPMGVDPVTTGAAVTLTPSSTNTIGISNSLARNDHTHQITGFQVLNTYLSALAASSTTGVYVITSPTTGTTRTNTGTTNQIDILNGSGVGGNPTFSIASNPVLPGLEGVVLPTGTTAQETGTTDGALRYNTDTSTIRMRTSGVWANVGTVTSVAISDGILFNITGSPITTSGTISLALVNQTANTVFAGPATGSPATPTFRSLVNADLPTSGITPGTYNWITFNAQGVATTGVARTILPTANQTIVANGDFSGNITIGLASNPIIPGTADIQIPAGTTGQQPVGAAGMIRFNTTTVKFEGFDVSTFKNFALEPWVTTNFAPITSAYVTVGSDATLTGDRAITGTTNQITITDNGANSTVVLAIAPNVVLSGTGAMTVVSGTTAQQPVAAEGLFRYNTTTHNFEFGSGLVPAWTTLGGSTQLYKENPSTPTTPVASGTNAVAIGNGSTASATNSLGLGSGSNARVQGQQSLANGQFGTAGDAQKSETMMRNTTTNATTTELFVDGATVRLALPNNSAFNFFISLVARRTDTTGGEAAYTFQGLIYRDANAASTAIQGGVTKTVLAESNAAWDANVDADTTNGSLRIQVNGEAAKTIRWVAYVRTAEVTN